MDNLIDYSNEKVCLYSLNANEVYLKDRYRTNVRYINVVANNSNE
jgi:hypothetical protein